MHKLSASSCRIICVTMCKVTKKTQVAWKFDHTWHLFFIWSWTTHNASVEKRLSLSSEHGVSVSRCALWVLMRSLPLLLRTSAVYPRLTFFSFVVDLIVLIRHAHWCCSKRDGNKMGNLQEQCFIKTLTKFSGIENVASLLNVWAESNVVENLLHQTCVID